MGEAKKKFSDETIEQDVLKDALTEKLFLEKLGENRPKDMKTELELMIMVYNQEVEALARWRFDLRTFQILANREPWNDEWKAKKEETVRVLRGRRATLDAIREQVLLLLTQPNDK